MYALPLQQLASMGLLAPTKSLMQLDAVMAAERGVLAVLLALPNAQWCMSAPALTYRVGGHSTAWLQTIRGWDSGVGAGEVEARYRYSIENSSGSKTFEW